MTRSRFRLLVPALVLTGGLGVAALPLAPVGASDASGATRGVYATIEGTGATDAELLVKQWIADVDSQGIPVVYVGSGSTRAQRDFEQGQTDYAVLDHPEDVTGRPSAAVPLVAGGLALPYHLEVGGRRVTDLRLSSAAVVGIFTGAITHWDDPVLAADNRGLDLPHTAVRPVVRADGTATTELLTSWLDHEQQSAWRSFTGGEGATSFFPEGPLMSAQSGADQLTNELTGPQGDGSIGYVGHTYALDAALPVAKVLNHGGYYVAPTQYAVALALRGAQVADDGSTDLTGVFDHPDRRAYPLSSFTSVVIPTATDDPRMTTAKRQSLVDLLYYSMCTGQHKAGPYGYAPLPRPLVEQGMASVRRLHDADPRVGVSDRAVEACDNPTFDGAHPDRDVLDEIAPYPPACDARTARVCGAPAEPAPTTTLRLSAPSRSGVHVVRPASVYVLTVRTTSTQRPRYYPATAPGRALRPGFVVPYAGRRGSERVFSARVHVRPTDARTWRLAVRVGQQVRVLQVRLPR